MGIEVHKCMFGFPEKERTEGKISPVKKDRSIREEFSRVLNEEIEKGRDKPMTVTQEMNLAEQTAEQLSEIPKGAEYVCECYSKTAGVYKRYYKWNGKYVTLTDSMAAANERIRIFDMQMREAKKRADERNRKRYRAK